ncbi:MAG: sugar ABC transporter substrate-binding protein [Planctomycetes bacterium]|nr:sugar ABC transporter substrate-binding protein [Planctomycetota bacterium]
MSASRREFLETLSLGSAAGLSLGMLGCAQPSGAPAGTSGDGPTLRPLKAAFSNAGLQSTWCELGKKTAELWGQMLNIDITWFDGEFDPEKQRNKIDAIVHRDWDFCCFQAVQIDSLAEPTRRLKERGIPVISMDTLLVDMDKMRETGVWTEVTPDHVNMAEMAVGYLVEKIGGKGKMIHIGGLDGHSGAQGRRQGFENIVKKFPEIEVVGGGVRWCDWKKEKARNTFESLLQQETTPIAGAFFHSDDMALASVPALKGTIHEKMLVAAVDGQKEGLDAVKNGVLAATSVNPVCRIHRTALFLGQFFARNKETMDQAPMEIITPGPLVTLDSPRTLEAMYYLADPTHCIV